MLKLFKTIPWHLLKSEEGSMGIAKTQITSPQLRSGAASSGLGIRSVRQWYALQASTALAGTNQGAGITANAFASPTAVVAIKATSTEPPYVQLSTLSTANSQAWFSITDVSSSSANNPWISFQNTLHAVRWRIQIPVITSVRVWIGLSDVTNGTALITNLVSDAPVANFIGYRFSTTAGDTTWKAIAQTSNLNQSVANTNVGIDTIGHTFTLKFVSPNAVFYIDDVQVATQSANVPPATTLLTDIVSVDNINLANLRSFNMSYFYCETI